MVKPSAKRGAEWRTELRSRGLRVTAPRLAVLEALGEAGSPLTHGELVGRLGPDGWDRATLYRNLVDLTEIGLVRRTDVGDHVWRFELADPRHDGDHRAHFVCDSCGDVKCLPDESVELHPADGAPRSFRARQVEIQIRGRCDNCA